MALERELTQAQNDATEARAAEAEARIAKEAALAAAPPPLSMEHRDRLWHLTQVCPQKGSSAQAAGCCTLGHCTPPP